MNFSRLRRELNQYKSLPIRSRVLIKSFVSRETTIPFFMIFTNAFIWRNTNSFWYVVVYNLALCISLPIGFYINGLLLKKINIAWAYFFGITMSVLSSMALVFFSGSLWIHFFMYGFFYGIGFGLYWSNRNYLTFQETNDWQRNYFFSILWSLEKTVRIFVNLFMGWAIVWGEMSGWYSAQNAYKIFAVIGFLIIIYAGSVLFKVKFKSPSISKIAKWKISKYWWNIRQTVFAVGLIEGLGFFVPYLLILIYLGNEGVLGTIGAMVSVFGIIAMYIYGRVSKPQHRSKFYYFSAVFGIFIAGGLTFLDSNLSIIIYVLVYGIFLSFQNLSLEPWLLYSMDKEAGPKATEKYHLIFDQELFLNIGRIVGILILFVVAKLSSDLISLKLTPFITSILSFIIIFFVWKRVGKLK